jgi:hypothetical protein
VVGEEGGDDTWALGDLIMHPTLFLLILLFSNYPMSDLSNSATDHSGVSSSRADQIPTVAFCEMVKNPQLYFDKSVRVTAKVDHEWGGERFLSDDNCPPSDDERVRAWYYLPEGKQRNAREHEFERIDDSEYGFRQMITVIGILRDVPARFPRYRYRFDIVQVENVSPVVVQVPTVAFCEMVKHPQLYFDKPVRVTAMLDRAEEQTLGYLSDDNCPLSQDDQIGIGRTAEQRSPRQKELQRIVLKYEYGSRVMVTFIGILQNESLRAFASYRYRFDIVSFEDVSPVVVPYEGVLNSGIVYQATVRGDRHAGLSPVPALQIGADYTVRIEWTNLDKFPALQHLRENSGERQIFFIVQSTSTDQDTKARSIKWKTTLKCFIISDTSSFAANPSRGASASSDEITTYEGTLKAGVTYQATVRGDRNAGLSLAPPFRIPIHYAVRFEWSNLNQFPALKRLRKESREQQIVFSVLSDEIRHVTTSRWNRTVKCRIIRLR